MEEKNTIHIPNLSLGNTKSVVNMINRIGGKVIIANSPEQLMKAKKIILPHFLWHFTKKIYFATD